VQFEEFCYDKFRITEFPWRVEGYKPITVEDFAIIKKGEQTIQEAKVIELAEKRGHEITNYEGGEYINKDTIALFYCSSHNVSQWKRIHDYKKSVYGVVCCCPAQKEGFDGFLANISEKGHSFKLNPSKNASTKEDLSTILIRCPNHETEFTLSAEYYCTKGLDCCGP
jgi:hypothetical protein